MELHSTDRKPNQQYPTAYQRLRREVLTALACAVQVADDEAINVLGTLHLSIVRRECQTVRGRS